MIGGKIKGRSSEEIARGVLEELGYKILDTNKMVSFQESEAFEVDIVVEGPDDKRYCVEVKSGEVGVSDVRHAFANGEALGMEPLLVSKGFANDAASALAEELGVVLVRLGEYYSLLEPEELQVVLKTAIKQVLDEYGFYPLPSRASLSEEDWEMLNSLAESESFQNLEGITDLDSQELGWRLGELRDKGVLPRKSQSLQELRNHARRVIDTYSVEKRLEAIDERLSRIEEKLD
ncbi:MAG: hypothetical protein ACLFVP_06395 [Candidatus Bathyarchaeia archaeon]